MKQTYTILTTFLALGLSSAELQAQVTTIASDNFDYVGRSSLNFRLNGEPVQTGTGTWDAGINIRFNQFNGERMIYLNSTSNTERAVLPFSYTAGNEVTLTWEVSRTNSNWLGGGFKSGSTSGSGLVSDGQVWMNLSGSTVFARVDGTATTIGSFIGGTDFSFSGGDYETMSLIYDSSANTVSGIVNGSTIFSDYDLGAFTPSIGSIALEWNNASGNGGNFGDSFNRMSLTSVPEPSAFALGAGLLALTWCVLGRRRI